MRQVTATSCCCFLIVTVLSTSTSNAGDFRVKSLIYLEPQKRAVSTNWTIFAGGKVLDFSHTGNSSVANETTVYDPEARTFTLLDRSRRVQTMIALDDVSMFIAQLKAQAVNPDKRHLGFLVNPQMTVKYDEPSKKITIECERLTYSAVGIAPKDETATGAYRSYADWTAQLNTTRGRIPPFVRMRLNRELATRQMIPDTIQLSFLSERQGKSVKTTYRSEHDVTWKLTEQDKERVQETTKLAAEYKTVTFAEYNAAVAEVASKRK